MTISTVGDFDYSNLHPDAQRILGDLLKHKMAKIENGHVFITLELDEEGFQMFFAVWKELRKKMTDSNGQ